MVGGWTRLGANDRKFGGFSGLVIDKTGQKFLTVSDKGYWLRGSIAYADGRPEHIINATIAPLRGLDGQEFKSKGVFVPACPKAVNDIHTAICRLAVILAYD